MMITQHSYTFPCGPQIVLFPFLFGYCFDSSTPEFMECFFLSSSSLHGRHAQDLAPFLPLQLRAHHTVDSRSDRVTRLVQQHAGVVVEPDDGAVSPLRRVLGAHDDGVADVAALDFVGGRHARHAGGGGGAVFLNHGDDAITCKGNGQALIFSFKPSNTSEEEWKRVSDFVPIRA